MWPIPLTASSLPRKAPAYDETVDALLRRLQNLLRAEADRRLDPHGLTYAQWEPLVRLGNGRTLTLIELARETNTDAGATCRMMDRLEAKGLCKRVRSNEDRRVVHLEITRAGEVAIEQISGKLADVMNAEFVGLSKVDQLALVEYLRRMLANGRHAQDSIVRKRRRVATPGMEQESST